jgi:asparagine N-glycosylation enzyme membrane subunit Stt3
MVNALLTWLAIPAFIGVVLVLVVIVLGLCGVFRPKSYHLPKVKEGKYDQESV